MTVSDDDRAELEALSAAAGGGWNFVRQADRWRRIHQRLKSGRFNSLPITAADVQALDAAWVTFDQAAFNYGLAVREVAHRIEKRAEDRRRDQRVSARVKGKTAARMNEQAAPRRARGGSATPSRSRDERRGV